MKTRKYTFFTMLLHLKIGAAAVRLLLGQLYMIDTCRNRQSGYFVENSRHFFSLDVSWALTQITLEVVPAVEAVGVLILFLLFVDALSCSSI